VLTIGAQRVIIADPTVVRLYALIERLAPVNIPVLITGETGCGKELVATALHTRSPRAGKTLISLNCAALHEMLVESELFGHERGAFSGASATKPGLIEAASGSTLFLDEIGELALGIQAKLLRVLDFVPVAKPPRAIARRS
jgi:two-component system response regulator AtoC